VADPRIRAFGVLLDTAARLERLLGGAMERESGISHAMFEVLLHLAEAPQGLPMGDLSRNLVLTSGGATRLVDRMVAAGLVDRCRSHTDKRVQQVTLTEEGACKLVAAARRHVRELDRHVFGTLSAAQAESMLAGLDHLGCYAREALPPLG
jgi:DNA-binding MarR family transcriptional regulator